ncbi:protein glxC [uncultured Jatrophihabitans sp.]|uniref:protein glxC n=1 Tax=uncultured Jatrophihabitans sp. TaxID=1610747 RepID=UPI0035CB6999
MIEGTVSETQVDLRSDSTSELNQALHRAGDGSRWRIAHPDGRHNLAVGLTAEIDVRIDGQVGYYCAGMNQRARVLVEGSAGVGVAENMMSGSVRVRGNVSQSAGATAHGGLLVIDGNAGARCGISLKGADIVVGGDVGHVSAFMAQAGRLVVCGDAGDALGDSVYETRIYVRGRVKSLGADCVAKPMRDEHLAELAELLGAAGFDAAPAEFTRYGSARTLYNYHVDDARQEQRP